MKSAGATPVTAESNVAVTWNTLFGVETGPSLELSVTEGGSSASEHGATMSGHTYGGGAGANESTYSE